MASLNVRKFPVDLDIYNNTQCHEGNISFFVHVTVHILYQNRRYDMRNIQDITFSEFSNRCPFALMLVGHFVLKDKSGRKCILTKKKKYVDGFTCR